MKVTKALLAGVIAGLVLLGVLSVFALELASNQDKSRHDIQTQVHDRAVLAAALIDSLFGTVQQQAQQYPLLYGGEHVTTATLDKNVATDLYLVLLGPGNSVLAQSSGFVPSQHVPWSRSAAVALVSSGHPYGLGNYADYEGKGVIDLAVPFQTQFGPRVLVTGFTNSVLSAFLLSDLRTIPGVRGENNYLVDGKNVVLAASNPSIAPGRVISQPGAVKALKRPSANIGGTYFQTAGLENSTWRMVLAAPDGPLFASVTGARQFVPWIIFAAFAVVAALAVGLALRVTRSAEQLQSANLRLGTLNAELVEVNDTLERRAAELARSNEELDRFASVASHDLQEPLRKIRTFNEQLTIIEEGHLSEKGIDYLRRANSAAERMQRLIEDLLKFSRVSTQSRVFVSVDLSEVTRQVLVDLEAQVSEAGAVVQVRGLPSISADPLQMQQLMQNLISNALKFRRDGVTPQIDIEGRTEGRALTMTVRDNGVGFDPRYADRIFRIFERLHGRSEYPGTGIGLALCRKIVERHGGTIEAKGDQAAGSTFTVKLPLNQVGPYLPPAADIDLTDAKEPAHA